MIRNKHVLLIFRFILGGLFIYAGVLKAADPLAFARTISNYRLVPNEMAFLTSIVLPWLEILSGIGLILGLFKRTSALLISFLLVFFIVLVAVTMIRGLDVDCGCFGTFSRKADAKLIVEDAIMLFMALQIAFSRRPETAANGSTTHLSSKGSLPKR